MKGQNLRIAIKEDSVGATKKYIAGALTFDLQIDCEVNDCSTKDSTSGWKENEAGLKSFSGSGQCQLVPDAAKLVGAYGGWDIADLIGMEVEVSFDDTDPGSSMNRTLVRPRKKGRAIINSWKTSAQNGQTPNADFSFTGNGALENVPTITGNTALTATTTNQTSNYSASDGSTIQSAVDSADTWLTATIANGVLTYKGSSNAGAERTGHVTLTTESGAELRVAITQAGAA